MGNKLRHLLAVLAAPALILTPAVAFASNTPNLSQTVNTGIITTDILQSDGTTPVTSPTVGFPALNRSFSCQTNTATLGDSSNRIYVTNFADMSGKSGWTLTMAATGAAGATWTAGSDTYKYNDATGSGCTNGQMTVNPAAGTITLDCNSKCTATGVTTGSSAAFNAGTVDNITLINSTNTAAWKGYLAGVGLSQKIPSAQAAGTYSLGMTLTATAQ